MVVLTDQHGVLTADQCAHVIEQYHPKLQPSQVTTEGGRVNSASRTSSSYKIPCGSLRSDIESALREAITEATATSSDRVEPWELLHYVPGAYYRPHVDWFHPTILPTVDALGGQRTHSVIAYLSEVEKGGETFFPLLKRAIVPCTGLLVTWNNMHEGRTLFEALHEARPVTAGEKWALVTWIRERTYTPG